MPTPRTRPKPKPATVGHLKKKKKPYQKVFICLEPDLQIERTKAETELEDVVASRREAEHRLDLVKTAAANDEAVDPAVRAEVVLDAEARVARLVEDEAAKQEALEKAEDAETEKTVYVKVQSLGRKKYDELVEEHPPTDAQVKEWQKDNPKADGTPGDSVPDYNGDTFPYALIADCAVEPTMTAEQVAEITEEWNFTEFMQLFSAAIAVNTASRVQPWGKDYG